MRQLRVIELGAPHHDELRGSRLRIKRQTCAGGGTGGIPLTEVQVDSDGRTCPLKTEPISERQDVVAFKILDDVLVTRTESLPMRTSAPNTKYVPRKHESVKYEST